MRVIQVALFLVAAVSAVNAQTKADNTILSGTIYDILGSVIVHAEITVRGEDKVPKKAKTNDEGVYSMNLKPGRYSVEAFAPNFRTYKVGEYIVAPSYKGR